jgi:hypothetical protein
MHILPAYFTSTNTRTRNKKKQSKNISQHDIWLLSKGLHPDQIKKKKTVDKNWKSSYNESMKVDRSDYVSSGLSGTKSSCAKRDIMTNLHKEPKHVQDAILEKASRVMPLYNKGGLQLLSPKDDLTQIGTKSRRG